MDVIRHRADGVDDDMQIVTCRSERTLEKILSFLFYLWKPTVCNQDKVIVEPPIRHNDRLLLCFRFPSRLQPGL